MYLFVIHFSVLQGIKWLRISKYYSRGVSLLKKKKNIQQQQKKRTVEKCMG